MPGYPCCCGCEQFGAAPGALNVTIPSGFGTLTGTYSIPLQMQNVTGKTVLCDGGDNPFTTFDSCLVYYDEISSPDIKITVDVGFADGSDELFVGVTLCSAICSPDDCFASWVVDPAGITNYTMLDGLAVPFYDRDLCIGSSPCTDVNGTYGAEADVLIEIP